MSVPEELDHAVERSANKFTAIYIAVLAVVLAVCSSGGDNASKDMMRASIDIADTYAFFQAKNIRQTIYEMAADDFEMERAKADAPEAISKLLDEKIAKYRATAKRYESEPATGDGKKELLAKARELEKKREVALQRDPYFDFGGGLLQIAIVLASSSIVLGGSLLLSVSMILGAIGTLMTVNGFALMVSLPFVGG